MKKLSMTLLALVMLATMSSGCGRYGMRILEDVATVAVAVAVTAAVLHHHDAHYHDAYCGHRYVIVEDRPVYHYRGRWEYYDDYRGRWYYYPDGPPRAHHHHHHYR